MPGCQDYTLTPYRNDNPLNGVSTFDLVLISKHILGLDTLDSPYQLIAADANRSGTVTTFDIVQFRKVILGIQDTVPGNTSWRFVDADWVFPDPMAPAGFPEQKTYGSLAAGLASARTDPLSVVLEEVRARLGYLVEVGLGYVSLDRPTRTLSGGETERVNLTTCLGTRLVNTLFVLDEPSVGLHPRDTQRLIGNLRALAQTGSTVLVVEHDEETIRAADHLLDMGPSGGRGGGRVVSAGPAALVLANPASPTAQALAGAGRGDEEMRARPRADKFLTLRGARAHNLRGVDLAIPVGRLTVVAGVSGSGKSTLVQKVFYPALRRALGLVAPPPLSFKKLDGVEHVKRALAVDQSPIGRTPRSVPATFLGVWDEIRRLYASLPESKLRGYTAQRFSFNTPSGGRCPTCQGQGAIVSEMSFLPDVVTACEACGGARFEPATLEVTYSGRHIGEILHLSADEAVAHFQNHPRITRPLQTLRDLGVGYLQLGQGSNTLSGGEAQRLKLAAELTARAAHEPTVYVLDEPTTGLHLSDVRRLISVLARLVDRGDTLVIFHPQVLSV